MSLSNPHENGSPNPAARWFEWNGEHGTINYYDKVKKETVDVPMPFTFILLDELGTVRGWHDASSSGIYSNEVKDTRQDTLVVKAFKGGTLAEGLYRDIKDRVSSLGGSFNANCYIAFKDGGVLTIGAIRFKGASLWAWMEFRKENRKDFYTKSVKMDGFNEGKKGRVTFRTPKFTMVEISPATMAAAVELDKTLQEFLTGYLSRNNQDQTEAAPKVATTPDASDDGPPIESYESDAAEPETNQHGVYIDDSDLPF